MGFLDLFRRKEKRTGVQNPAQWLVDWVTGGESLLSGVVVNEKSALKYAPIWAAVNIISSAIGFLPCFTYKRLERGKERATKLSAYSLLHTRANPLMSPQTFRETMQGHVLTWGNGYAEIERNAIGEPVNLWPLRPDYTKPVFVNGNLNYEYREPGKEAIYLPYLNVFHVHGLGFDGFQGYSPIRQLMETIGLGRAAEQFGAGFFGNGSRVSGVLQTPAKLSDPAYKKLRDSWKEAHTGLKNAHRLAILEEGVTWQQIGIPPEEAQFLETRKFQVNDIARMYQIPPHMIADLEHATFSNIEHQGIEFVTHTLTPWLRRWEYESDAKLIGSLADKVYFTEFLVDAFLRGDIQARYGAYATGRQWGWLSANDIREKENMNPVEGGDEYLVPMNMNPADKAGIMPPARNVIESHRQLLMNLCDRIVHKEVNALQRAVEYPDIFKDAADRFYATHSDYIREVLEPAVVAYASSIGHENNIREYVNKLSLDYVDESRKCLSSNTPKNVLIEWESTRPIRLANRIIQEIL